MSNSKAIFSWSRGTNGPSVSFLIEYQIGDGDFISARTTKTSFDINDLKPDSQVTFRVAAVGIAPNDKQSAFAQTTITIPKASIPATTSPVTPTVLLPPDPTNVSVEATTKNEAIVKWNIPSTYTGNKEELVAAIPAIQPVSNKDLKRLASGFGRRIDPFLKVKRMHYGLDFSIKVGTPIYATADGKAVVVKTSFGGFGKHIYLDHGNGYRTVYAHLDKFNIKRGQKVKRGEL